MRDYYTVTTFSKNFISVLPVSMEEKLDTMHTYVIKKNFIIPEFLYTRYPPPLTNVTVIQLMINDHWL